MGRGFWFGFGDQGVIYKAVLPVTGFPTSVHRAYTLVGERKRTEVPLMSPIPISHTIR